MSYTITNGLCTLADVKAALRITDTVDDDRLSLAIDSSSRLIEKTCNRRFWQDPAARTAEAVTLSTSSSTVADTSILATDAGRQVIGTGVPGPAYAYVGAPIVPGVSFTLVDYFQNPLVPTVNGAQSWTIGLVSRHYVSNDPWLVEIDDASTTVGLTVQSDYAGDGSFGTTWAASDYQAEPVNGMMEGQAGWPTTALRAIRSLYFPVWGGIAYPRPYTQALVMVTARWGWAAVPSDVNQAAIVQSIATFKAVDVPFGATPFGESGVLRMKMALHPTADMLLDPYKQQQVLVA